MSRVVFGDTFGKLIAEKLEIEFVEVIDRVFPDGELQPRITEERKCDTGILCIRKKREEGINDYLVKYLLVARKLREFCEEMVGIIPYFPYARQDKVFREGEPLSSKYVAEMLESTVDKVITVTFHSHRKKFQDLFEKIKAIDVSGFRVLAEYFKNKEDVVVIGPDSEAYAYVKEFAEVISAPFYVFKKERDVTTGEIEVMGRAEVKDKNIIIVDDIVSTGGTMVKTGMLVKKFGCKSLTLAFVHGMLSNGAIERLKSLEPKEIVATNTIENPFEKVDVTGEIINVIKELS